MKAVIFKDVGVIALENVPEPTLQKNTDAIVKITTSTICGTDLHIVRGTLPGYKPGTILGHEGVGIVEQIGEAVQHIQVGDRVIIPSTIACGDCYFCKKGVTSQCDRSNPNGPQAGVAFFGGPIDSGSFDGMQAEKVRVPFADAMLIKIPSKLTDEQVILLSDILPTAYMGVEFIDPKPDDKVAVFGAGPVGQLVIACLKKAGVQRIYSIDHIIYRLKLAEQQGAHAINFDRQDPVKELRNLTDGQGPDKVIDAVGIDAEYPAAIPSDIKQRFEQEVKEITPTIAPGWHPGNGPSQALDWAIESVSKAGLVSVIGVYTELLRTGTIGSAMGKNLTLKMGDCNHRTYIPKLLEWVEDGSFDPTPFLTQRMPFAEVIKAYEQFNKRQEGWLKVILTV